MSFLLLESLFKQSYQLIRKQDNNSEHQMQTDLGVTFYHYVVRSELFFQTGIGAFYGCSDFVSLNLMGRNRNRLLAMGVPVYIRYMPKLAAYFFDSPGVILAPGTMAANSPNARKNVDSEGISPIVSKPVIFRRFGAECKHLIRSLVGGCLYSNLAIKERASAPRSSNLC